MTKEEFKKRWESDDRGGGITFDDIAECAKEWELFSNPKCHDIEIVRYAVLVEAKCEDTEDYKPEETLCKENSSEYFEGYMDAVNKAYYWLEEHLFDIDDEYGHPAISTPFGNVESTLKQFKKNLK